jgi:hypothetical protein
MPFMVHSPGFEPETATDGDFPRKILLYLLPFLLTATKRKCLNANFEIP